MAIDVVSNAGPLMVFSKLNVLHLLKGLYGRVEFPLSVSPSTILVTSNTYMEWKLKKTQE
jgi:hypothetical protein